MPNKKAVIETKKGTIELDLFADEVPGTVANFEKLANSSFYDGTKFHRVIPNFMRLCLNITGKTIAAWFWGHEHNLCIYEPYLDLSERNRSAYDASSCFALAPRVRGKLTIMAGSSDFMCYHDALEMSRKLMDHGVDHELVVVAGDPHGYIGKAEDYFFAKLVKFLGEHVKDRKVTP